MLLALIPFIGWIVLFIFFVLDSEQGDNAYGVDPKGRQSNFVHRQNEYFDSANFTHSENRKEENSFSQKCQRCSKTVLKRSDFTAELSKMGLKLDAGGNITVSGAFSGYGALQNLQQKVAKMEGDKAIQCKSCGKVYCVDCLAIYAPQHPTSGGKACFSCRGSLQEI